MKSQSIERTLWILKPSTVMAGIGTERRLSLVPQCLMNNRKSSDR